MVEKIHEIRLATRHLLTLGVLCLGFGILIISFVNRSMRQYALKEAERMAQVILDRNLATHTYFTHQLKPKLFEILEPVLTDSTFEPSWMSSTFAIREQTKYFAESGNREYYYKECALNARSPENEADSLEAQYLLALNRGNSALTQSGVRYINGKPYFYTLRQGERMESSCLRCHSTSQEAPAEMVRIYGPDRSFGREPGQIVSAISIRIPLDQAYARTKDISRKLSTTFLLFLVLLFAAEIYVDRRWLIKPLDRLRQKTHQLAVEDDTLGQELPVPRTREFADLTRSFNHMSLKLKAQQAALEERVQQRTAELEKTNQELLGEIEQRIRTEDSLRQSESRYQELFNSANDIIVSNELILNTKGEPVNYRILNVNPAFEKYLQITRKDAIGHLATEVYQTKQAPNLEIYAQVANSGTPSSFETFFESLQKYFLISVSSPGLNQFTTIALDITAQKQALNNQQKLISELQETLKKVKTLSGLLPICANCKKIRDDQGYWNQLEAYFSKHTDLLFSHGLCPDCMAKLYPGWLDDQDQDQPK
jgi:PAS domain-containing protein